MPAPFVSGVCKGSAFAPRVSERAQDSPFHTPAYAPLTEVLPASAADGPAALGFSLAWAAVSQPADAPILWAAPETAFLDLGALHAEGLAQWGIGVDRLLFARARSQAEALWATEEALRIPATLAFCLIAPSRKALSLTATRRLLLAAERAHSRCLLLRLDAAEASAAWLRWRVESVPSHGQGRELGRPRFVATLARSRHGPAGRAYTLEWNAHERTFSPALDGAAVSVAGDGAAAPQRTRAA